MTKAERINRQLVLLRAIMVGVARWEPFPGDPCVSGEICVNGLRHVSHLDANGLPLVTYGAWVQMVNAISESKH